MRKFHALAAGVFAMMSALPATAVTLNPKGLGQALIYPYYTVNKGQDTLVSVVNASDVGKYALVQFREGYNGRAVLEFYLYLSARDTWTAVISEGEDGGAKLVTADSSCTRPAIPAAPEGLPFTASTYSGTYGVPPWDVPDSGPQTIARVREGHIEIIARGDIAPGSAVDIAITPPAEGEAPLDCASVPAGMFTSTYLMAGRCWSTAVKDVSEYASKAMSVTVAGTSPYGETVNVPVYPALPEIVVVPSTRVTDSGADTATGRSASGTATSARLAGTESSTSRPNA